MKPSKPSTSLNRTTSPVALLWPGSRTLITAEPLDDVVNPLRGRRTSTEGSTLSGLGSLIACGSECVLRTINCGCLASHSSLPTSIPVHSLRISRCLYAAPERSEMPMAYLFEAYLVITKEHLNNYTKVRH